MRYVVDSSVAFKWVVTETHSDKAIRLREDFRSGVHELLAPDIFPAEIANALLMAERRGRIAPGHFPVYLADVLTTCPSLAATIPLLLRGTGIVASFRITIYDCLYVALAERERCGLVTADEKLINNLSPHFPFLVSLSSLP